MTEPALKNIYIIALKLFEFLQLCETPISTVVTSYRTRHSWNEALPGRNELTFAGTTSSIIVVHPTRHSKMTSPLGEEETAETLLNKQTRSRSTATTAAVTTSSNIAL